MSKLNRWPSRREPPEQLPDFDETNQALDDTVSNLRALDPHRIHGPEVLVVMQGTIHEQNVEIRLLRKEIATLVQTVNGKASKTQLGEANKLVTARLDSIAKYAGVAIAAIGLIFALASYFVGRK